MSALRVVLAGGTGQVGTLLARHFHEAGHSVTVVSRSPQSLPWPVVQWDGQTLGAWASSLEGTDVLINVAGRSVNCRYTPTNRRSIMDSRINSTRVLGEAVAGLTNPPRVWMNASTATIYRHSLDRAMDEANGELGGQESDAPSSWRFSIEVAKKWESVFFAACTPRTRKVALRSAVIMSPDRGGAFDLLLRLVRFGVGGTVASGRQYVSWIHDVDFANAVDHILSREELDEVINLSSPNPLPNRDFMSALRKAYGMRVGLPAPRWILEIGTFLMQTESELVLKSRRVIPGRLLGSGFRLKFPDWSGAAYDLVNRWRSGK